MFFKAKLYYTSFWDKIGMNINYFGMNPKSGWIQLAPDWGLIANEDSLYHRGKAKAKLYYTSFWD